jgi:SAM-dependent methyltransferase
MDRQNRWTSTDTPRGDAYDQRFAQLAARGVDIHGEANFVSSFAPRAVLDAGCGTGRVAIELARRGVDVVGVDIDPAMLAAARRKAPELTWVEADLATLALGRRFDVVVAAGNVLVFVAPGTETAVVHRLAAHLDQGGRLVAGFSLAADLTLAEYDSMAAAAGLVLEARYSTWQGAPFATPQGAPFALHDERADTHDVSAARAARAASAASADYAVSVHRVPVR